MIKYIKLSIILIAIIFIGYSSNSNVSYYNAFTTTSSFENNRKSTNTAKDNTITLVAQEVSIQKEQLNELPKEFIETITYTNEFMNEPTALSRTSRKANYASQPYFMYASAEYGSSIRQPVPAKQLDETINKEVNTLLETTKTTKEKIHTPKITQPKKPIPPTTPQTTTPVINTAPKQTITTPKKPIPAQEKNVKAIIIEESTVQEPATKKVKPVSTAQVKNPENLYNRAMQLMKEKKYIESRKLFMQFINTYKNHTLTPNALYWEGETYYSLGKYADAITRFIAVVNRFPKDQKSPDALLKIAMSYMYLKDRKNAKKYQETLLKNYPKSSSAKKARNLFF